MFRSYVTLPEGMKKCYVLTQQNMYLIIYIVLALLAFGKGHRDKKTTHLNHLALSVPATRTCILNGSPGCITISYLWNIANWDAWVGWWLLPFQQLKENQPPNWQSEMLLRRKIPPVPTPQRKTGNKTPQIIVNDLRWIMGANQAGSCEVPTRLMNIVNDKRKKEEVKSEC